jgi:hypothetical protein
MIKFISGMVAGFILATVVFVAYLVFQRSPDWNQGHHHGTLDGRADAAKAISKEFGEYDGKSPYKVLFSIKTTDVISVETNGVKTVRVIP